MTFYRSASAGFASTFGTPSYTCNAPPGVVQGDMLVLCQSADSGALTDMGTPTGGATWTLLDSAQWSAGGAGMKIWMKIAGASEPSSYGLTQNSSASGGTCSIIAVANPGSGTPVVAHSSGTSSATITTPSTTPNGADDIEIRFVGGIPAAQIGVATFTPPAGLTERTDVSSAAYTPQSSATRTLTSSGATGALNFTASQSMGSYLGFTVNIRSQPDPRFIGWGMRL